MRSTCHHIIHSIPSRRGALKCLAFGGLGTVFVLAGGVLTPVELALAAQANSSAASMGVPLFLQISDSHIGFNKEANPDVAGTLKQTIDYVNAMPVKPALTIHTGDITHLSKASEFDLAAQLMSGLKITELHTVPGEHDVTDGPGTEYFKPLRPGVGQQGLLQLRSSGRAFCRPRQRDALQAERPGRPRRRATGVARKRSQGTLVQHADRRLRAHADVDDLRAVGMGHRRCGTGDELSEALRFGHGAERPHSSDRVEGGGQHHVPHGALHRLSAADSRQRSRPRSAHGGERSAAENAWRHQHQHRASIR